MKKAPKLPKSVRTVKALCALIRAEFHMSCDRMKINNWQTRHSPPFPCADENNAFDVKECFAWIEALQKRKGVTNGEGQVVESQMELLERKAEASRLNSKIIDEEEKKFELDKKKGKYIPREEARSKAGAALQKYHSFVCIEFERNSPLQRRDKLKDLGVSPDLVNLFFEWDKQQEAERIDRIAQRCEQETKEADAITI